MKTKHEMTAKVVEVQKEGDVISISARISSPRKPQIWLKLTRWS
jgi:hypothetical protein